MTKEIFYKYLGVNGIITTPVLLEGVPCVKQIRLTAEPGKVLTKDGKTFCTSVNVSELDLDAWSEVSAS